MHTIVIILSIILILCGAILSIIREDLIGLFPLFIGIFILFAFGVSEESHKPKRIIISEEKFYFSRGDTLQLKEDGNYIEIYIYHKNFSRDSSDLYIVK